MTDELFAKIVAALTERQIAYSVSHAAEATDCGRSLIYQALGRGDLIGRKLGDRTILPIWEIIRWLDSLPAYKSVINQHDFSSGGLPAAESTLGEDND